MNKKIIVLIIMVFSLFLVSCNNKENTKTNTKEKETEITETKDDNKALEDFIAKVKVYVSNPDEFYELLINEYNSFDEEGKAFVKESYDDLRNAIDEFLYQEKLDLIDGFIKKLGNLALSEYESCINDIEELLGYVKVEDVKLYDTYIALKNNYLESLEQERINTLVFTITCPDTIHVNDVVELKVECSDSDVEFEFKGDNNNVYFNVNDDGRSLELFGDMEGVTNITISIKGSTNSKVFTITVLEEVINPTKIYYDSKTSFTIGDEFTISYRVMPSKASQDVIISCNNDCLNIDGLVCKAKNVGECTLTIKCKDFDLSIDVKVNVYNDDVNNEITLLDNVTREMTSPRYWINKVSGYDNVIMSLDEILAINEQMFGISNCKLVDILNQSDTISKADLLAMINRYTVSSSYRINGGSQPSGYAQSLYDKCNKNNVSDVVTVQYGLINTFCDLRSFPTNDIATSSGSYDRFQETGLEYGEGVLVYHVSTDGNWYFVQCYNYNGWVEKDNITLVTKDVMTSYVNPEKFIIVTAEELEVNGTIYRMSTKFPYEKVVNGNYQCPLVTKEGMSTIMISVESDVNVGYLPYTTENVLKQVFKLLGNLYSWGDDNIHGHDCSSTMNACYKCFGFIMPRNTSNQQAIPLHYENLESMSTTSKERLLDSVLPGTLVFLSGHVTMYIGCDNGIYYLLHNFGSGGGCNISTVLIPRSGSNNYIESFIALVEMK